MTKRTQTKKVKVGNVSIGGNNNVVIQSMTNTKTSDTTDTLKQIKQLYDAGCKLVRVAIVDNKDLLSLKTLVQKSLLPIIADIHFKYQYAIQAIKAGVAAIRINPGNLGGLNNFKKVITEAKKHHCAIRIGINTGSLPTSIKTNKQIIDLMKQYVSIAEKNNFKDLVLSIKSSDTKQNIQLNKLLSQNFKYPLHIGVTEAGPYNVSIVRSTIGLLPLLESGIGDTIRISITGNPIDEIHATKTLLNEVGIKQDITKVISCPTCGRTSKNFNKLFTTLNSYIIAHPIKNKSVAIMGCYVNGIVEAKTHDLGIFASNNNFVIIYNKKTIGTYNLDKAINTFIKYYKKLSK